jgi:hypothetical protein
MGVFFLGINTHINITIVGLVSGFEHTHTMLILRLVQKKLVQLMFLMKINFKNQMKRLLRDFMGILMNCVKNNSSYIMI